MQRPIEGRECDFLRAEKLEKVVCYLVKWKNIGNYLFQHEVAQFWATCHDAYS